MCVCGWVRDVFSCRFCEFVVVCFTVVSLRVHDTESVWCLSGNHSSKVFIYAFMLWFNHILVGDFDHTIVVDKIFIYIMNTTVHDTEP